MHLTYLCNLARY